MTDKADSGTRAKSRTIVSTSPRDQPGPSAFPISAFSVMHPYGTRDDLEMKRFLEFTLEMEMFRGPLLFEVNERRWKQADLSCC